MTLSDGFAATLPARGAPEPTPTPEQAPAVGVRSWLTELASYGVDEESTHALLEYAYATLTHWLTSGEIVRQVNRRVGGQLLTKEQIDLLEDEAADVIQDTITLAWQQLVARIRAGNGWSPDGGASLRTYFVVGCAFAFAQVFRKWIRGRVARERAWLDAVKAAELAVRNERDPAEIAIQRVIGSTLLTSFTKRTRQIAFLKASGLSHSDVAAMLDMSTRAVEGVLHRARRAVRYNPECD